MKVIKMFVHWYTFEYSMWNPYGMIKLLEVQSTNHKDEITFIGGTRDSHCETYFDHLWRLALFTVWTHLTESNFVKPKT